MNRATINFWVDTATGIAFVLSAISGPVFPLPGDSTSSLLGVSYRVWDDLHTLSSLAMITGVGLHLALHWRWIVSMAKRMLCPAARAAETMTLTGTHSEAGRRISRRAFLCTAGAATVAAGLLLAGSAAILGSDTDNSEPDQNVDQAVERRESTRANVRVACPFGLVNDPYPGRCRRYTDSNGNGLCDYSQLWS